MKKSTDLFQCVFLAIVLVAPAFAQTPTPPSITSSTAAYAGRLASDPAFFGQEKTKWLKEKSNHEHFLEFLPFSNDWEICLLPIGLGSLFLTLGNVSENPLISMFGGINLAYGAAALCVMPFRATDKEHAARLKYLELIGRERGFVR